MALLLPEHNLCILEMPKTGTTWIRYMLTAKGIEWQDATLKIDACPRHSPACCYDLPDGVRIVGTVRKPLSWMSSLFRFGVPSEGDIYLSGRYYAHQRFWPIGNDFSSWVQENLFNIEPYFDEMLSVADTLIHNESLEEDLAELIGIQADVLKRIPLQHVTRNRHAFLDAEQTANLLQINESIEGKYYAMPRV